MTQTTAEEAQMPATTTPPERTRMGRLAGTAFRRRRLILAAWIVFLASAVGLGSTFGGEFAVDYATPGSESKAAQQKLQKSFDGRSDEAVDVVWRSDADARSEEVAQRIQPLLDGAGGLEGLTGGATVRNAQVSRDGHTAVARIALDRVNDEVPDATAEELLALSSRASAAGLDVAVGGPLQGLEEEAGGMAEMVGLAVAALVLVATFGGVVAAGLPLLTAVFGVGIAAPLGGVVAAVVDSPDWAPQVAIMLGLGVGIDYALLILTRHRAALAAGKGTEAALVEAMTTAGRSVVTAGGTVVVALMGLFLMGLPYLYGVALAASLSVLVVLVASVTLLPALIAMAGRRVNSLRVPGAARTPKDPDHTLAARWARRVQRRPKLAIVASLVVLLVLTAPVTGVRFGFPDAGNNSAESSTRQAYDLLAEGFGAGSNGPLLLVASSDRDGSPAAIDSLAAEVANDRAVASVSEAQASPDGSVSVLTVEPRSAPQAQETKELVDRLRDGPLADASVPVQLGGQTAAFVDQGAATAQRLPLFIGAVIGLSFLLLVAAFRAPVIALKAGVLNVLSIGAAYGVVALVAEGGFAGQLVGIDSDLPVPPFIPVMMFASLFGLSMDYEVFLMSRIREERELHGTKGAVLRGVARTARVITAAAAIMIAVFAAFALSPEVFLKLIGIGLATAILIDATIVRMVLVPAVMELLGERAWWTPRWLARPQRSFAVEPARG